VGWLGVGWGTTEDEQESTRTVDGSGWVKRKKRLHGTGPRSKGSQGKKGITGKRWVHTYNISRIEAERMQKRMKERGRDGAKAKIDLSSPFYATRGSSLVSIKPSAFTAGAASSDPGSASSW
jgi:hypothetical protein